MGSVGLGNNAQLGAFLNRVFPEGLDLGRCQIESSLGVYVANPASAFRAGSLVAQDANGLLVPSNGVNVLGVAKWNHATSMLSVVKDEPLALPGTSAQPLKHANISNVRVTNLAGTPYTVTTDYTVNATNGTIANAAAGIGDGETVLVSYTWAVPESDLMTMQGKNFWNSLDEVSQADGRCTVITSAPLLFTAQYDTSKAYTLTGATSNVYASVAAPGLFTSDNASSAKLVGRVFQVPTAADPFLGVRLANLSNLSGA